MDASINTSVLIEGRLPKVRKSDALCKLVNCVESAKKLSYPQTAESPILSFELKTRGLLTRERMLKKGSKKNPETFY